MTWREIDRVRDCGKETERSCTEPHDTVFITALSITASYRADGGVQQRKGGQKGTSYAQWDSSRHNKE